MIIRLHSSRGFRRRLSPPLLLHEGTGSNSQVARPKLARWGWMVWSPSGIILEGKLLGEWSAQGVWHAIRSISAAGRDDGAAFRARRCGRAGRVAWRDQGLSWQ